MPRELNHGPLRKLWTEAGRTGYHLAMAVLAEHGERRQQILDLMSESEREAARGVLSDRR